VSKLLEYTPGARLSAVEMMVHIFFDDSAELRQEGARMPNGCKGCLREHLYRLQVDTPRWDAFSIRSYQNKLVTFTDTGIQLPLPEALSIHALFSKAFNAPGTAEFFRDVLRDQEVLEVAGPSWLLPCVPLSLNNPQ